MALPRPNHAFLSLQRSQRYKQNAPVRTDKLGDEMVGFFKQVVQKRQGKLGKIANAWIALVPQHMSEHCSLEGLARGTLTVLVDSSSHLYELKQLLLAGLQKQLLIACKSEGLKKITLKPGRWYEENGGVKNVRFD